MLAMTCLTEYASKGVDSIIRKMVNDIFGRDDILERLPIYFMKESYKRKSQASNDNICSFNGRKIQFSTVHKVKGETHDSTLYLETEKQSSSDLKRVLSYLKGLSPELVHYVAPVIGCGNLPVCNRSTEDCSDIWTASVKVNMMSVSHTVSMGAKAIGLIKGKA